MSFIGAKPAGHLCIFGAPFDATTSFRPGARFGPEAIRSASYGIETFSPLLNLDLENTDFMDDGDLELPFGNPEPALDLIMSRTAAILSEGRLPILLGGEHLVSLGAIRAAAAHFEDLKIIHLDAHADLRDEYLGQKLSHATVMRRAGEICDLDNIRQIGIRSCDRNEFDLAGKIKAQPQEILTWAGNSPCYLTLDLDVLDPAFLPGTGTPEPGGMSFNELLEALMLLIAKLNIVALDMVELAPMLDHSGVSAVVAAKLLRECLLALEFYA